MHVGVLQETNFEVSKLIILLLFLYNLALQNLRKWLLNICYFEMTNR